eukprot:7704874-Ditylum_brightwellii.AAC.1
MWTGHYCYGLQRSIPYPLDGAFQNFVLALNTWKASLLDSIRCPMDIFTARNKTEQSKFLNMLVQHLDKLHPSVLKDMGFIST